MYLVVVAAVGAEAAAFRERELFSVYTKTWAVELDGGETAAETLAAKWGFIETG